MTFTWAPELAAETPPFRGEGAKITAKRIDATKLLAPVPTSLAPHRAPDYRPRASIVALATTGKGSFADEADALVILAATGQKGPFKGQITMVSDAETEKVVNPGVDRWVQEYGVVGALDIFALLGAWKPYDLMSSPGFTMRLAAARLRRWLAHVPDYAAALAKAEALAAAGMPAYRGKTYDGTAETLAYLFPDHRPFFAAAVAELARTDWTTSKLLAAVTSVDEYRQIASVGAGDVEEHALVVARSLREAGLPILRELAATHEKSAMVARALTAYVSTEAAETLAGFAAAKKLHPILIAYFTAHPELAPALEPHTRAKEKARREGAAKVLAAVQ